jgi:phosphate acetyltransferase
VTRTLLVISAGNRGNGLTSVSLGLVRALQRQALLVGFCKPIAQPQNGHQQDGGSALARLTTSTTVPEPLARGDVERLLAVGDDQILLERVVERCAAACIDEPDLLVVEGLVPVDDAVYGTSINIGMARALNAQVVLVGSPDGRSPQEMASAFALAIKSYGLQPEDIFGVIVNKIRSPGCVDTGPMINLMNDAVIPPLGAACAETFHAALALEKLPCLGLIPYSPLLGLPRIQEVATALNARVINAGNQRRRVHQVEVAAMTLPNVMDRGLKPGVLLVTPGDRVDTLLGAAMTEMAGTKLAGILLSGAMTPPPNVLKLCEPAFKAGLPVLMAQTDTLATAQAALTMNVEIPVDDRERAELVVNTVANALDVDVLWKVLAADHEPHVSPPAFRHMLIEQARAANKRIILPEGTEPRTIAAATICTARGIARCVLVGRPDKIRAQAERQGLDLTGVELLDPRDYVERYVEPLCELRKHKNLHPIGAKMLLRDDVFLGTMMLKMGDVDGLVSGAVHTTANTIRPALQLIKTAPGYSLVSSVFFMCLPQQVLVYGDCAVNPDPSATDLADIAIQSAESAEAFGITPRIAMISYSTGTSGQSADVTKVAEATEYVSARRPEMLVDGPLQYDAASVESVGRKKAPDSKVAGRATVFVFPDLNTGNTVYKAVQRSANVVSIGPMLQGLDMPVNDLSRGALVEDIVFTIALTAIQAKQRELRVR